jgi:hypothetical protein
MIKEFNSANSSNLFDCGVGVDQYRWNRIETTPALSRSEDVPGDAMSLKAVPLRSKCILPEPEQIPPGHSSVITTVTALWEHKPFSVHFTCLHTSREI